MHNFTDKIKRYFPFNTSEIKAITITIIFLTFIVAFNDGSETFSFPKWLANFFLWSAIVTASVLASHTGHRLLGLFFGFRVEYKIWWYGLMIGVAIAFVSRGNIWILIPGGIIIHHMTFHRVGWFRYGTNMRALSLIALAGPLANVLFATIIKTLQIWFHLFPAQSLLVDKIFLFNLAFAAYNLLPIPPLAGSRVFFDSRLVYVLSAGCISAYAILAYLKVYSYIIAIIIGVLLVIVYYLKFES